jgi:hypothetical protein
LIGLDHVQRNEQIWHIKEPSANMPIGFGG